MSVQSKFFSLLREYSIRLVVVFFVNLLSVFFAILSFFMIEPFINLLFKGTLESSNLLGSFFIDSISHYISISQVTASLWIIVLCIVLFFLLKNFFLFLSALLISPLKSDIIRRYRSQIYTKILLLPIGYFTDLRRGDIVSRAVNDTQELEFTVLKSIQQFLTEPLSVLIYLLILFALGTKLTLFVLILLPISAFVISFFSRKLRRKSVEQKQRLGDIFSHVEETIAGLRAVKGFNSQAHVEEQFAKYNDKFTSVQKYIYRRVDLASPLSEVLGIAVVMTILVYGGMQVLAGNSVLSPAMFIVYIAIFTQIINPAKNIATAFSNFKRGVAALDRIYEVLESPEKIVERENPIVLKRFQRSIRFDNLSFAYQEEMVLRDINMEIKKGEVCALVGPSGSGKSTIADLLPRFYDATQGRILFDGEDLRDCELTSLRSQFAMVTQDVVLFNDTVFNNIAYGMLGATEEQVEQAANMAGALTFIQQLPDGFDTQIGDRGLTLSGGQRQRLSLARAFLHNAPILILDEATSALDSESEKIMQETIAEARQNQTILMIAHRLSTVVNADRIFYIEGGQIVESGTHNELMALQGKYYKLIEIEQTNKYGKK